MNVIERLEEWKSGSKDRAVEISHDNGYGASCWSVTLYVGTRKIVADAVWFVVPKDLDKSTKRIERENNVYVCVASEDEFDDWPTLEQTINVALDEYDNNWIKK